MSSPIITEQKQPSPVGIYYLSGVMEVGSGFQLSADHTFEFFFSYGATDFTGNGTWEQQHNSIILKSPKKPPLDFRLIQAKSTGEPGTTIKIVDENPRVVSDVLALMQCDGTDHQKVSDQNGLMVFEDNKNPQQISLIHRYWPQRYSVFHINEGEGNYFEFGIEPWIIEVEFDNMALTINENGLTGRHPLLEEKQYQYFKEK